MWIWSNLLLWLKFHLFYPAEIDRCFSKITFFILPMLVIWKMKKFTTSSWHARPNPQIWMISFWTFQKHLFSNVSKFEQGQICCCGFKSELARLPGFILFQLKSIPKKIRDREFWNELLVFVFSIRVQAIDSRKPQLCYHDKEPMRLILQEVYVSGLYTEKTSSAFAGRQMQHTYKRWGVLVASEYLYTCFLHFLFFFQFIWRIKHTEVRLFLTCVVECFSKCATRRLRGSWI